MLAAIVFGLTYTILQIALTLNHISKRNGAQTSGDGNLVFDFYGDKVQRLDHDRSLDFIGRFPGLN